MAGGGMNIGQIIGATNPLGEEPVERPVKFQEVFATLYHNLGIDLALRASWRLKESVGSLSDLGYPQC